MPSGAISRFEPSWKFWDGETPETSLDSAVTQAGGMNSQPSGEGDRWESGEGVTLMGLKNMLMD